MNETLSGVEKIGLKAKAVRSAGITILTQFVSFCCNTISVIILSRLLTPKAFGIVAMVTAFSNWVMNFGINGFTEYIVQKREQINEKEVNSIFWVHLFLASFLSACFIYFGSFLVHFYEEPALFGIAAAMATSFVFYALCTSHLALLKRNMKFKEIANVQVVAVALSVAFAISAAYGGIGYWAIVIRQLTVPCVMVIGAWILCPWRPGLPRNLKIAFPGLKYAFKVYCNFSIGYVTRSIDRVLLGKFHGAEILGNYDRAFNLSSLPAAQLLNPLHSVALATLSRLQEDKKRLATYYMKAVSILAFIGSIAGVCLALTGRDLILLILGPKWSGAGPIVIAFGPGIFAMFIYQTHSWLHLSLGTPGRWLRWNFVAGVSSVSAFIIAAPYGAIAMASASSIRYYVLMVPALWYAGRPVSLSVATIMRSIWVYFCSGIIAAIGWFCIYAFWPTFKNFYVGSDPVFRIAMTCFIATFFYFGLIIILQRSLKSFHDIISLMRIVLSQK